MIRDVSKRDTLLGNDVHAGIPDSGSPRSKGLI